MGAVEIRNARQDDAAALLAIYAPYVTRTAVSFELEVPSVAEFAARIAKTLADGYPYLVAESDGRIVGYAYAGVFNERAAYARSAELSVYVAEGEQGRGVGRALYSRLEAELSRRGVANLYACIAHTERKNDEFLTDGSERFHAALGFRHVGIFTDCASKFGRLYSMVWMDKSLAVSHGSKKTLPEPTPEAAS